MLYLFIRCIVFFQVHGWFLSKFLSLIVILFHVVFTSLFILISSFLSTFTWGLTATFFLFVLNREIFSLQKNKLKGTCYNFSVFPHLSLTELSYDAVSLHVPYPPLSPYREGGDGKVTHGLRCCWLLRLHSEVQTVHCNLSLSFIIQASLSLIKFSVSLLLSFC